MKKRSKSFRTASKAYIQALKELQATHELIDKHLKQKKLQSPAAYTGNNQGALSPKHFDDLYKQLLSALTHRQDPASPRPHYTGFRNDS